MTKATIQPLESYRLVQYVVPIPCYICEAENTYDAEYCHLCLAPMALSHQANSQNVHPQMVAVMGASGVGKTVYLGMLMDMLSRQADKMQVLTRGAFSITLQQTTISALSRCSFPRKTPNEPDHWNWVHCQVRRPDQRQDMELLMPDMAGEAISGRSRSSAQLSHYRPIPEKIGRRDCAYRCLAVERRRPGAGFLQHETAQLSERTRIRSPARLVETARGFDSHQSRLLRRMPRRSGRILHELTPRDCGNIARNASDAIAFLPPAYRAVAFPWTRLPKAGCNSRSASNRTASWNHSNGWWKNWKIIEDEKDER